MRTTHWTLVFLLSFALGGLAATPSEVAAAPGCACLDTNADELCTGADTLVDDNDWLKGPGVGLGGHFAAATFVIPAGCSITVTTAPNGGIVVHAGKIVVRGQFISTPTGGEGVQFNSLGDVLVDQVDPLAARPRIEAGGANKLTNNAANAAVAKSSVALRAGGICRIVNADLRGNPIAASGQVGMQCTGETDIHGSTVIAAGIDIQSLTAAIDATATAGALPPIGIECDVNVAQGGRNLLNGNNNGVLDAGDFPCRIDFASAADVQGICIPEPPLSPNEFRALNNPLVMIAKLDLRLEAPAAPGNLLVGRFGINLVAEDGNVSTDNSTITNDAGSGPLGGARIFLFANPTSVNRSPVLKEKSFGPSAGTIGIDGACYVSFNDIRFGQGDVLTGTPAPPPCAQLADFVAVLTGP